jgi:hypothetical protein
MRHQLGFWASLFVGACAGHHAGTPGPAPALRFTVLGNASPADTGGPTLRIDSQVVTIHGLAVQTEGVGLYGDLDLSEPHTVRLTLYDSLEGRPVDDPLPPAPPSERRQIVYEARIGPLAPGGYVVWIGRFDAKDKLVEVSHAPLHITVPRAPKGRKPGHPDGSSDSGH